MGSYCAIYFDKLSVIENKSVVPNEFCAIFQESDRQELSRPLTENEPDEEIFYRCSRADSLARLDLVGYTIEVARQAFDQWLQAERARWAKWVERDAEQWAKDRNAAIQAFTFEEWLRRVPEVLRTRYAEDKDERGPIDLIDEEMKASDGEWLWFDGYGSLANVRALLEACPRISTVTLGISDLIGGGYLEENEPVCKNAREHARTEAHLLAPVVILGEGASDIRILRKSLEKLFPERKDYFSFFDHTELSVDGGTSYLVKFLKAFAAASAPFRMVAIFDNDAAGSNAVQQARRLGLPENIMLLQLPIIEIANEYPTTGPQGDHVQNVNGRAASIELYLGRNALTRDGQLRKVRWGGFVPGANAYQGEVDGKAEVEVRFYERLEALTTPEDLAAAFPELRRVWEAIFATVQAVASRHVAKIVGRDFID